MSSIEWTDTTWNPVRGCSIVSPGCVNCYAMKQAHRFSGEGRAYHGLTKLTERSGPQWTGKVVCDEEKLLEPLSWKRPRRVFVNSMSDLFHEDVPDAFILRVFDVMERAKQHTFQVLTKRPARMLEVLGGTSGAGLSAPPLPNVWLGVSAEDQPRADERIPLLLETPAAVRFVSAEPLLGPIDFHNLTTNTTAIGWIDSLRCIVPRHVDWVIVGGESGPGARPMDLTWARLILEQCKKAGVACFVKQLGAEPIDIDGLKVNCLDLRDHKGGDPVEWPDDLRVREWPELMPERAGA